MCGLVGGFSNNILNTKLCKKSLFSLQSRGPDNQKIKYFENNTVFLGHTRLNIIDLTNKSNQPFSSKCLRYNLIFNGEIYNYKELKKNELEDYDFSSSGDTEVLLNLFLKYGYNMLEKLKGMFAFAIYDKEENKIFIARDRFGIKPIYYYSKNKEFYFASEIKAIIPFMKNLNPDERTIKTYLQTSLYDFNKNTFFNEIKSLEAGHFLVYDLNKKIDFKKRWYHVERNVPDLNYSHNFHEELNFKIDNAVKSNLVSDVTVGLNISGGLDSSILLNFADKHIPNIHTFTQQYDKINERQWVEKIIIDHSGQNHFVSLNQNNIIDHLDNVMKYFDEPFGGLFVIGYSHLYELAGKNNVTVLLDGNGIDEIFLGYQKYHLEYLKDNLEDETILNNYCTFWEVNKANVIKKLTEDKLHQNLSIDGFPHKNISLSKNLLELKNYIIPNINIFEERIKNLSLQDLLHTKLPRALRFNDSISMMHSKELRVPFLDHELVEFAFGLPISTLINQNGTKSILRELMSNKINSEVAFSKKRSLQTPQNDWLAKDFRFLVEDVLNSISFKNRNWIDIGIAKQMYTDYIEGDKSNSFFIWQWINLELWAREIFG